MRKLFTLTILLVAFAAGLYTQRVEVSEWYREWNSPELPEAVTYENVVEDVEDVEDVQAVDEEPRVEYDLSDPEVEEVAEEEELSVEEEPVEEPAVEPVEESVEEKPVLPASINLAVPFTSQAPQGSWDEPYQEACEEASVYMVHAYFSGMDEGQIPADTADKAILQIVEFEMELFGVYKDTTAEKTGVFAELLYGHTYQLLTNPTVEDIQRKLVQGHPVIVPAAGRLLGNPYFTAPGPLYHMLVIRGYTDGQFIVNDPGTYRGEAYLYDFDTIMNAMHDWNDGGEITDGKKVVLVLSP
jgi:hypothetical protein